MPARSRVRPCASLLRVAALALSLANAGCWLTLDLDDKQFTLDDAGKPPGGSGCGAGVPPAMPLISRDVPAFALMLGVPARHAGWMSRHGERLALPVSGDGEARCPHTGDRYVLRSGAVQLVSST